MTKNYIPNENYNGFKKFLLSLFPGRNKSGQKPPNPPIVRRVSLGIKLPAIVIILLILAFLISTFLSVQTSRSALIGQLQETLLAQSASQAELIRSHLVWTRSMAVDLAAMASTVEQNQTDQLNTIESTLANNDQVYGSTIAYEPYRFQPDLYYWSPYYSRDPDGRLRFTQLGNPDYDYFKWDWYTLPKSQRAPVLSPAYFDKGGGEIWMVTWSVPFFDSTGNVKGVATADIAFSQTQEIVRQIAVGTQGYAFLIDKQGTLMGIGDHGGKYQIMVDSMLAGKSQTQDTSWTNLINSMVKGGSGFANATDPNGQSVFVAYQPIGLDTGWSLGLAFPQTELFQPATRLRNALIIFAFLVAMIFAVILFFFTRTITRPLQKLTLHTVHFSQEELEKGQMVRPIQIQTNDELEDLANSFNTMTDQLRQTLGELEQRVAERTKELRQANDDIQGAHEKLLQSEKQASLGRLASGVAHEINTPLAASRAALVEIRKLVEECDASLGNPEVTPDDYREINKELFQSLSLADNTLERIAGFVHGIKDQTRDVTYQEHLNFNAIPVIRESLLLVNHALRAGNCTVTFEPAVETAEINGIPSQLAQVVINLLTNAIDANAEKGGGPIVLLLTQQADWTNLQVIDQGNGIPPEIQSKIFDLLFTTKPVGRGTGLGLTIARDIMTDMFDGSIDVTSQAREGTTFTLRFPRSQGDQNGAQN